VGKRAHTLRGVAGNIGARELQLAAQSVEEGVRDALAPDRLAPRIDQLHAALVAVFRALDTYFDSPSASAIAAVALPDPGDTADHALAHLQVLLSEFSGDTTDYFDAVRARLASVLDSVTLDRLSQHLSRYEFEEARVLLTNMNTSATETK
jgi:two-component system sensor histidine kinase/response regulator